MGSSTEDFENSEGMTTSDEVGWTYDDGYFVNNPCTMGNVYTHGGLNFCMGLLYLAVYVGLANVAVAIGNAFGILGEFALLSGSKHLFGKDVSAGQKDVSALDSKVTKIDEELTYLKLLLNQNSSGGMSKEGDAHPEVN